MFCLCSSVCARSRHKLSRLKWPKIGIVGCGVNLSLVATWQQNGHSETDQILSLYLALYGRPIDLNLVMVIVKDLSLARWSLDDLRVTIPLGALVVIMPTGHDLVTFSPMVAPVIVSGQHSSMSRFCCSHVSCACVSGYHCCLLYTSTTASVCKTRFHSWHKLVWFSRLSLKLKAWRPFDMLISSLRLPCFSVSASTSFSWDYNSYFTVVFKACPYVTHQAAGITNGHRLGDSFCWLWWWFNARSGMATTDHSTAVENW